VGVCKKTPLCAIPNTTILVFEESIVKFAQEILYLLLQSDEDLNIIV